MDEIYPSTVVIWLGKSVRLSAPLHVVDEIFVPSV
jgi:hypothetical protein